jgi:hypothetical protein
MLLKNNWPDFWPVGVTDLVWHPVCHKLFLVYRDRLRKTWATRRSLGAWSHAGFLLGLENSRHEKAISHINEENEKAASQKRSPLPDTYQPLVAAWKDILDKFPRAKLTYAGPEMYACWPEGNFRLMPQSDFQRAFYLLFAQSWRARVCLRCKALFVARRPKQLFCGTTCSAGSRLASKRKWWAEHGKHWRKAKTKRRTRLSRGRSERTSRGEK